MPQNAANPISRRRFLKAAGATAVAAAAGPVVIIPGRAQPKTLKIMLWKPFVPSYGTWFEGYANTWGEKNDTRVVVDWRPLNAVDRLTRQEAAAQQGHDIIQAQSHFEDQLIDHRELYEECQRRYGKVLDLAVKRTYNPKTARYFGVCTGYVPSVVVYRKDLWDAVGVVPDTWEDIRSGGRRIKFYHERPVGLGLHPNTDSNVNLLSLLYSFGGSEQDNEHRPALKSPQTLEALKFVKAFYEEAMSEDVLTWGNISNNRAKLAGEISLALNPISITRTAENKQLPVNDKLSVGSMPGGPAGRFGVLAATRTMGIWKFAQNIDSAQQFLVDYAGESRQVFLSSRFFWFPTFPQTVPDLAQLLADDPQANPSGRYQTMAQAQDWSVVTYWGYENAATREIYDTGLITTMFANAATGKMTPEEALTQADQEVRKIFGKWRDAGKV